MWVLLCARSELKVSEIEFVKEITDLLDKWRKIQEDVFKGSGPRLIWREMGITTSVIRDLFSDEVTAVVADQKATTTKLSPTSKRSRRTFADGCRCIRQPAAF